MEKWDERSEQWIRSQADRDETFGPATEKMLDMSEIKAGCRLLDVAAGAGGQTLLAARRVGASGYVLATDISTNMLKSAADAVRTAGLTNVETRVMNAGNLDLDADSFDVIICRLAAISAAWSSTSPTLRSDCVIDASLAREHCLRSVSGTLREPARPKPWCGQACAPRRCAVRRTRACCESSLPSLHGGAA